MSDQVRYWLICGMFLLIVALVVAAFIKARQKREAVMLANLPTVGLESWLANLESGIRHHEQRQEDCLNIPDWQSYDESTEALWLLRDQRNKVAAELDRRNHVELVESK